MKHAEVPFGRIHLVSSILLIGCLLVVIPTSAAAAVVVPDPVLEWIGQS